MKDQFCILIHYHEISLKGKNRSWFEKALIRNIKKQLISLPLTKVYLSAARIFCSGIEVAEWGQYKNRLKRIIGIKNATLMHQVECTIDSIQDSAAAILSNVSFDTFRVSTKRQYKDFFLSSQKVNEEIGWHIQSIYDKSVKLKNADIDVIIELVKGVAYIGYQRIQGYGGLPMGTSEHAISMISSGIDSPVASFSMIRRGVNLSYVHFHSSPATSRQSVKNVEEILKVLAQYQIQCQLYLVPLLEIQQKIMAEAPNRLWVILFRRAMIHISSKIADSINAPALISGESVGQVASQTLSNIQATSEISDRPILRPLCGMNKEDIITIAQEIGTYDISIEPYEDCCSFFIPMHPETKASLDRVIKVESAIDFGDMFDRAIENTVISLIKCTDYMKTKEKKLMEIND